MATVEPETAMSPIGAVVVTIPARDEEGRIARCLRSVDRAAARCPVRVVAVVAADGCRDDTVGAAESVDLLHAELVVVAGNWRGASAARAAATSAGLAQLGQLAERAWLASTDADCVVPVDWLDLQLRRAGEGVDAVAGIVRLAASAPPALRAAFAAMYGVPGAVHRHVHAANLGVRADVHRRVGGWHRTTVLGEEHDLWRRLTRGGYRLEQPSNLVVTTSHRTRGRVIGGFASTLARLERLEVGEATA